MNHVFSDLTQIFAHQLTSMGGATTRRESLGILDFVICPGDAMRSLDEITTVDESADPDEPLALQEIRADFLEAEQHKSSLWERIRHFWTRIRYSWFFR